MGEERAQVVLLVRAFEEADREGRVISPYARTAATRRALAVTGLYDYAGELSEARNIRNGETVMRRARVLFDGLDRKLPVLRRVLKIAQLGSSTAPAVIGAALVVGLLTNLLGPRRLINLLSLPMLALLAWNMGIYVAMAVSLVVRLRRRDGENSLHERGWLTGGAAERLSGIFLRGALGRRLRARTIARSPATTVAAKAIMRFAALWHRMAAPMLAARVRCILHVGAAAVLVGAIVGMYVRGIGFEYRATWESTWLGAAQVQAVLGFVLGPASWVLGGPIPDVLPLRGPGGSGPAAPWIHLYAMTAVLVVLLPRAALALIETWRGRRMARRLPVDLSDAYFTRIFTAWRGATQEVRIVPYSFRPQSGAIDTLKTLLHDFFGARAHIRAREPLAYGDDASALIGDPGATVTGAEQTADREIAWVVLFNLAQSPEAEVHGRFLEQIRVALETRPGKLLTLIDVSTYHGRVEAPERRTERLQAWKRVCSEAGVTAVDVALDRPAGDEVMVAVGAGVCEGSDPGEGVPG
jgi:hypothetical protein